MRYIFKRGDGGYHLNKAHENPPRNKEAATSRWSSFGHREEVLQFLLSEQYHLCCYSEIRADELKLGYHIEHVQNKSQNPVRTFDFSNLAASALESEDLDKLNENDHFTETTSLTFGGHATGKQDSVDMQRFVSPHQSNCARFFTYLSDGRIVPADGLTDQEIDRAEYTIELLNLDSPFLQTQRRKWWEELSKLIEEHDANNWDLHCLASIDLIPRNDLLSPFFSITRQLFKRVAEDVLSTPELLSTHNHSLSIK